MTGTPIENHLGELWSLFEFLNPGMLGRSTTFNALDEERQERQRVAGACWPRRCGRSSCGARRSRC